MINIQQGRLGNLIYYFLNPHDFDPQKYRSFHGNNTVRKAGLGTQVYEWMNDTHRLWKKEQQDKAEESAEALFSKRAKKIHEPNK